MDHFESIAAISLIRHARWLGVIAPLDTFGFDWNGSRYYHVSGINRHGRRVLIEVFRVVAENELEAVLAFQYPPPIRKTFPAEYGVLHGNDEQDRDSNIAADGTAAFPRRDRRTNS